MTVENLAVSILLSLIVCRQVVSGLRPGLLIRQVAAPQQHNNIFHCILERRGRAVIANNRIENGGDRVGLMDREDSVPETYLRRIAVLTGAIQIGDWYVLDVDKTRFFVRDGYIKRLRHAKDRKCPMEETCFYPSHQDMPAAEKIGSALLQLKNNPTLFARWAVKNGAFKANGEPARLAVHTGHFREQCENEPNES
jgi:hypothetical protein